MRKDGPSPAAWRIGHTTRKGYPEARRRAPRTTESLARQAEPLSSDACRCGDCPPDTFHIVSGTTISEGESCLS